MPIPSIRFPAHPRNRVQAPTLKLRNRRSVKAEVTACQVLLAADGDRRISRAYDELVEEARRTAGREAHEAWKVEPVTEDRQMNMPELFERLAAFRQRLAAFEKDLARATLPRRLRWLRR